ncbi:MAG: signal peptidase I [Clostridiales Family XIII bacterium]|nr:signal peptidase I [Clostridiales Family XIII bacterium]
MDKEIENIEGEASSDFVEDTGEAQRPKGGHGKGLLYLARDIAIALIVTIAILQFVKPTIVLEHSMEDTLHPSDYVFLASKAYKFGGDPKRGDIVVFKSELVDQTDGRKKSLIKRIIAIGGDTISIKNGSVILNGEKLVEPYTKDGRTDGEMSEVTVPEGKVFAMGDNRQVSKDSRSPDVGFVDESVLTGKVFFRLFPISAIGKVD